MKEKMLITGSTGFVGKYLVPKLMDMYDIILITRDIERAKMLYGNRLVILYGDMYDINSLTNSLKNIDQIDYIINLVGGGPLTSNKNFYDELYKLNVETLKNLVYALDFTNLSDKIKLFIHISSLAAIGALNSSDIYNEDTVCQPVLPYEIAKFESEKYLVNICDAHKYKILILRPPQIYGKESKEILDMIKFIKKGIFPIFSDTGSLPLIHIDNFIDTITYILQYDSIELQILVCGENYKYFDIINMVRNNHGVGGYIKVPYIIAFIGIKCIEIVYHLLNKIEPINTYRLKSMCKNRRIDDSKFKNLRVEFRSNLQEFIKKDSIL